MAAAAVAVLMQADANVGRTAPQVNVEDDLLRPVCAVPAFARNTSVIVAHHSDGKIGESTAASIGTRYRGDDLSFWRTLGSDAWLHRGKNGGWMTSASLVADRVL